LSLELFVLLSGVTDHVLSEVLGKSYGALVMVLGLNGISRLGLVDNDLESIGKEGAPL
jgi:hypothetical protein